MIYFLLNAVFLTKLKLEQKNTAILDNIKNVSAADKEGHRNKESSTIHSPPVPPRPRNVFLYHRIGPLENGIAAKKWKGVRVFVQ